MADDATRALYEAAQGVLAGVQDIHRVRGAVPNDTVCVAEAVIDRLRVAVRAYREYAADDDRFAAFRAHFIDCRYWDGEPCTCPNDEEATDE